jgi:DNA-binding response OmpR family regulator
VAGNPIADTDQLDAALRNAIDILVVDDEPSTLAVFESLLAQPGRHVITARGAKEALERFDRHDLALVILDIEMPDMNGYEVAERMRSDADTSATPIIFVTASYTGRGEVFRGYDAGAVDYLIKPVDPHILRSKVDVFCQLHDFRTTVERQVREITAQNRLLEDQLAEIQLLQGLLPICSGCKKIKKDDGYWQGVEVYFRERAHVEFSHSMCPDCLKEWYPEYVDEAL